MFLIYTYVPPTDANKNPFGELSIASTGQPWLNFSSGSLFKIKYKPNYYFMIFTFLSDKISNKWILKS